MTVFDLVPEIYIFMVVASGSFLVLCAIGYTLDKMLSDFLKMQVGVSNEPRD